MTTRFDELGSEYLAPALNDVMGETIVVHPQGRASYSIQAIVDRDLASLGPFPSGHPVPSASLEIENHATRGVLIKDLDRGTMQFEIALERPGGKTTRRHVNDFTDVVAGMITVFLR